MPTSAPATAPATAPAPIPNPLMLLLEHTPLGKPLEDAGFTLSGFIDGGYTASFQHPAATNANIAGRFQDNKSEHIVLDQIDFMIDRPVDYSTGKFDVGGHFEFVYGRDTEFFHSTGIYDNPFVFGARTNPYYKSTTAPENQADIVQAYLDFSAPVGSGLRIRVGKIVTLLGWEVINPTGNAFYSHSYLFSFAIPLTQTGVMGEYKINPEIQIDAGITRGWSQSLRDNNGDPDFLGGITYTPQGSDFLKKLKFIANLSEGPQASHDNSDWWTVVDLQAIYTDGPLTAVINADYGDAPNALPGSSAQWGGAAFYVGYTPGNQSFVTLNSRLEWYQDAQGYTLAGFVAPTGGTPAGVENLYEATFGANVTWFPDDPVMKNLVFRPEIRFDYASKDFFNGDTKHFQTTFGIDLFFKY
ncbi:MAG TPA: outer membrane beta-barrel protein [Tepidisphaeraceae bacterium]|nr:outer membrane beta-barrel protein [Tepidisphaeraceae bacterium]